MASKPKTTLLLNCTSNTQDTEKKSRVFKLRIYGKGVECHSNHSLQLFGFLQKQQITIHVI